MIGYNRLGVNGRFGNQLFQYASLRGIAAKHGYEFCIPTDAHRTANYGIHDPFKLYHLKYIQMLPMKQDGRHIFILMKTCLIIVLTIQTSMDIYKVKNISNILKKK